MTVPLDAIEAIVRLSPGSKDAAYDLVWEWCIECWSMDLSAEEFDAMWAKREKSWLM